jgi:hypothetical protein
MTRAARLAMLLPLSWTCAPDADTMTADLSFVDHLVYVTPDLEMGIATIERLFGVTATPGGQHPQWGTRNALVSLGASTYLEILGPDPEQPVPEDGYPLGIDDLDAPRLVTWAAKGTDLERFVSEALEAGIDLGNVSSGTRARPDGVTLSWQLTAFDTDRFGGVVPFFIDWGSTPHPASTSITCCTLVGLRAEHPDAEAVGNVLQQLGLDVPVTTGGEPALVATIQMPQGTVELR